MSARRMLVQGSRMAARTAARMALVTALASALASLVACERADVSDIVRLLKLDEDELSEVQPPVLVETPDEALALLREHCIGDTVPTEPLPILPRVSGAGPFPERCEVGPRLREVEAVCGPSQASSVVTGTLAERLAGCAPDTLCRIDLEAGEYRGDLGLGCVHLVGANAGDDTVIRGTLGVDRPSVVQHVRVIADYGAVSTTADLLLSEVTLIGGYEGLGLSWDQEIDVAICHSVVTAGYVGVNQSWGSRRVTVAFTSIAACYEATSANWGSSLQHVTQSLLVSNATGASIHQSFGVAIVGNVIAANVAAVDIFAADNLGDDPYEPDVRDILVRNNRVLSGSMPVSNESANIIVD